MVAHAYSSPTPIFFGDSRIESRVGCQQGDVFSPLLFCMVLRNTLASLQSDLAVAYLDDVSLCSRDPERIEEDISRIQAKYAEHGLRMNPSKCEILVRGFPPSESRDIYGRIAQILPGCRQLSDEAEVDLLGAPVYESGVPRALEAKGLVYDCIFRRLQHVGSHVATYIMQRAAGVPKLTYLLRASPAYRARDSLSLLDEKFAAAFEGILKISLSGDAHTQLSPPYLTAEWVYQRHRDMRCQRSQHPPTRLRPTFLAS